MDPFDVIDEFQPDSEVVKKNNGLITEKQLKTWRKNAILFKRLAQKRRNRQIVFVFATIH